MWHNHRAQELCESRGGRPGLLVPNSPYSLCGRKVTLNGKRAELRNCVKVEVAVLGSPSLIVRTVSVYVLSSQSLTVQTVSVDVLGSPALIVRTVTVHVKQHCGNTGVERIPKQESAQEVHPEKENSPASPTTSPLRVRRSNH